MKNMIVGAFALCLMVTPALADGGSLVSAAATAAAATPGSGDTVLISAITVDSARHVITTNGHHSVNFGSINAGNVTTNANYLNSDITAPTLTLSGPGSNNGRPDTLGDITLYATSHTAIGATTYYESGFAPTFAILTTPVDPFPKANIVSELLY